MSDRELLWGYVEVWHGACDELVRLAAEVPEEQWDTPTDLDGWSVIDNIAHTAHLEAILAGAPEETVVVPEDLAHVKNLTGVYTEQGVIARRGRPMGALLDELTAATGARYAALAAQPPHDASAAPARTPGGVPWDTDRLLQNRPLDVWMHEQDVRRAIGRPGGFASPAAAHTIGYLADALPVVVGKRVAPPVGTTVVLSVPDMGVTRCVEVGEDGRARQREQTGAPTVRLVLSPEDFVVLAGGRRGLDRVDPEIRGDRELGRRVLGALAVTP